MGHGENTFDEWCCLEGVGNMVKQSTGAAVSKTCNHNLEVTHGTCEFQRKKWTGSNGEVNLKFTSPTKRSGNDDDYSTLSTLSMRDVLVLKVFMCGVEFAH